MPSEYTLNPTQITALSEPTDEIHTEVLVRNEHINYSFIKVPAGQSLDFHRSTANIGIYVIQGAGELSLEDECFEVSAGEFVYIPAMTTQKLTAHVDLSLFHALSHSN